VSESASKSCLARLRSSAENFDDTLSDHPMRRLGDDITADFHGVLAEVDATNRRLPRSSSWGADSRFLAT
jgi:hypothetical protein